MTQINFMNYDDYLNSLKLLGEHLSIYDKQVFQVLEYISNSPTALDFTRVDYSQVVVIARNDMNEIASMVVAFDDLTVKVRGFPTTGIGHSIEFLFFKPDQPDIQFGDAWGTYHKTANPSLEFNCNPKYILKAIRADVNRVFTAMASYNKEPKYFDDLKVILKIKDKK